MATKKKTRQAEPDGDGEIGRSLVERFPIGSHFKIEGNDQVWKVTDVGTRVVVAVAYKSGWMAGPPYALPETVFDEDDQVVMRACEVSA